MLLELRKRWKENNHEMNEQITTMREAYEQVNTCAKFSKRNSAIHRKSV